ncbi:MAG: hypothetical protein JNM27_15460 [Leptospirales bacterium]|nr:hypothetical protein [Leptospirales bacterium]
MKVSNRILQALLLTDREGNLRAENPYRGNLTPVLQYLHSDVFSKIPTELEKEEVPLPWSTSSPGEFEARLNLLALGKAITANSILWNLLSPKQKEWCQLEIHAASNQADRRRKRAQVVSVMDLCPDSHAHLPTTWHWNLIKFATDAETKFRLDLEIRSAFLDVDQWFAQTAWKLKHARKAIMVREGNQMLLHVKDALLLKHEPYIEGSGGAPGLILRVHVSGENITASSARAIVAAGRSESQEGH